MKTESQLLAIQAIRLDRLLLETGKSMLIVITVGRIMGLDAPWCSMTTTQASRAHINTLPASLTSLYFPEAKKPEAFVLGRPVKGRNEPMAIGGVAWVLHKLHEGTSFEQVTEAAWKNTIDLFGLHELNN